ncbi:MAG: hypothetical protein HQL45_14195 [Alphaproteobacteria bacterium]|nr:hypothetical protein [Alphaproteobacteria bacterium]
MPVSDQTDIALSGVLAEIAEIAGTTAALQIAHARGGMEKVYIPGPDALERGKGSWLVEAVGYEAALKIARHYGTKSIDIPLGPFAGTLNRARRAMAVAIQDGSSNAKAAQLSGLHQRTARRMSGYLKSRSPDLFERKV